MIKRLRRWWCSRQHDLGYRIHDWKIEDKYDLVCLRCGVVREGIRDETYAEALESNLERIRKEMPRR